MNKTLFQKCTLSFSQLLLLGKDSNGLKNGRLVVVVSGPARLVCVWYSSAKHVLQFIQNILKHFTMVAALFLWCRGVLSRVILVQIACSVTLVWENRVIFIFWDVLMFLVYIYFLGCLRFLGCLQLWSRSHFGGRLHF